MRRSVGVSYGASASACACVLFASACTHEVHPEYHPEARYSYVQNVTYAENAWIAPPSSAGSPGVAPSLESSYALGAGGDTCEGGRAQACWRECFKDATGESCARLADMFARGDGVTRSPDNARRLAQRACDLGTCGQRRPAAGVVSSPGTVIVYGDFNGNVVLGR